MAHCPHCGAQTHRADRFCGQCGKTLVQSNADSAPSTQHSRPSETQGGRSREAFPVAEGVAAWQALLGRKRKTARAVGLPVSALFAIAAVADLALFPSDFFALFLAFFAFMALALSFSGKALTQSEYNALPGAMGRDGQPRCLCCGHRGVHIHGQYRSHAKHHDCSRCKVNLYRS